MHVHDNLHRGDAHSWLGIHSELLQGLVIISTIASATRALLPRIQLQHSTVHEFCTVYQGQMNARAVTLIEVSGGLYEVERCIHALDYSFNEHYYRGGRQVGIRASLSIIHIGRGLPLLTEDSGPELVLASVAIGFDNLIHFYQYESNADEMLLLQQFEMHTMCKSLQPYITSGSLRLLNQFSPHFGHGIALSLPGYFALRHSFLPHTFPNLAEKIRDFTFGKLACTHEDPLAAALYGICRGLHHACISISVPEADTNKNLPKHLMYDLLASHIVQIAAQL
jgi:uridine phosphorylase